MKWRAWGLIFQYAAKGEGELREEGRNENEGWTHGHVVHVEKKLESWRTEPPAAVIVGGVDYLRTCSRGHCGDQELAECG